MKSHKNKILISCGIILFLSVLALLLVYNRRLLPVYANSLQASLSQSSNYQWNYLDTLQTDFAHPGNFTIEQDSQREESLYIKGSGIIAIDLEITRQLNIASIPDEGNLMDFYIGCIYGHREVTTKMIGSHSAQIVDFNCTHENSAPSSIEPLLSLANLDLLTPKAIANVSIYSIEVPVLEGNKRLTFIFHDTCNMRAIVEKIIETIKFERMV